MIETTGPLTPPIRPVPPVADLEKLNAEQHRAVEHGLRDGASASAGCPQLIIAGAGSGNTNTRAHRVAYLIVRCAYCSRPSSAAPPPR